MYFILDSYNKISWSKENVIKKSVRRRKCIYNVY